MVRINKVDNTISCYQEISLLESNSIPHDILMSKVFTQLHLCFVKHKINLPISFPNYSERNVGLKIRVFGPREILVNFNLKIELEKFSDYVYVSTIRNTASCKKFVIYKRFRDAKAKGINNRLNEKNPERVKYLLKISHTPRIKLPFIYLKSNSNGSKYPMFISKNDVSEYSNISVNSFGLGAVVPDF